MPPRQRDVIEREEHQLIEAAAIAAVSNEHGFIRFELAVPPTTVVRGSRYEGPVPRLHGSPG